MARVTEILQRWRVLQGNKSEWHNLFEDLARILLPGRMGFASTTVNGDRRTDDLFDSTPMQAARGLSNAIGGLMRPEGH